MSRPSKASEYLYRYSLNKDNEPIIICSYTDSRNITILFPNLNIYKKTSMHKFKTGAVYPYSSNKSRNEGYNTYNIQDSFVQVFYYDYKGCSKGSFIIDKTDFDLIKDYTWSKTKQGYFGCHRLDIALHDFLISPQEGYEVDHVNRLRFDNRRANLKLCTRSENQYNRNIQANNTSGLVGVSYNKKHKNWRGQLKHKQVQYCEAFSTKLDAAIYRRRLELEYSRYFLRPELEEYLLENISDENLLIELELKSK